MTKMRKGRRKPEVGVGIISVGLNGTTHNMPHEYFVLQIDGHAKSGYRRFADALKAAVRLKDQFPHHNVKVRTIPVNSPSHK